MMAKMARGYAGPDWISGEVEVEVEVEVDEAMTGSPEVEGRTGVVVTSTTEPRPAPT
jgi:hypothetical protein